jgi:hypothetical protein
MAPKCARRSASDAEYGRFPMNRRTGKCPSNGAAGPRGRRRSQILSQTGQECVERHQHTALEGSCKWLALREIL